MSTITPMEAYATTDGNLFPTKLEAELHQFSLDIKPEVLKFFNVDSLNSSYFADRYDYVKVKAVIDWETAKKRKELEGKS
jgi:hypothetical protein